MISTPSYAESCEQKWAKYYKGKSFFKPWCHTEKYKRKYLNEESCEQKWAKYYRGEYWFKPWCDTESYKRRQSRR